MNSLPKDGKLCSFPIILNDFYGGSFVSNQIVELAPCEKSCEREQAVILDEELALLEDEELDQTAYIGSEA